MRGQPGHNTQPHARLQPSFQGIDAWITSKLNEALVCIHGRLYNQALADVRSTGAGVTCQHCMRRPACLSIPYGWVYEIRVPAFFV